MSRPLGWAADFLPSLLTWLPGATVPAAASASWGGAVDKMAGSLANYHLTSPKTLVGTFYFGENSCYVFANGRQNHDLSLGGSGRDRPLLVTHSDTMACLETHTSSPAV